MKQIKKIGFYVGIYSAIVVVLLLLMVGVLKMIPRTAIAENLRNSLSDLKTEISEFHYARSQDYYTYWHKYADEMLLDIVYCMDANHPWKAVMESLYQGRGQYPNLQEALEQENPRKCRIYALLAWKYDCSKTFASLF